MDKKRISLNEERMEKVLKNENISKRMKKEIIKMLRITNYFSDGITPKDMEDYVHQDVGGESISLALDINEVLHSLGEDESYKELIDIDTDKILRQEGFALSALRTDNENVRFIKFLVTISQLRHEIAPSYITAYEDFFEICVDKTKTIEDINQDEYILKRYRDGKDVDNIIQFKRA